MSALLFADQVGVSTNICNYSIGLVAAVNHLSQHFNIVEIELENQIRHFFDTDKIAFAEDIKKLWRLKSKKGLQYCLHAPYLGSETDLSTINPVLRQEALWRMMESLELAVDLGCNNVTYYPLVINKKVDKHILLANLQQSLAKLTFYAGKLSVKILLEYMPECKNYTASFHQTDLITLCKIFNLKLALNLSQYQLVYDSDEWCVSVLQQLLPHLGKVYIANTLSMSSQTTDKKTSSHYQRVLSYLYQHGFKGSIIIERKNCISGFGHEDNQLIEATAGFKNNIINSIGQTFSI